MGFSADHIRFSYNGRPALSDIRLSLEPGHFYGILGPNGCGKSTLIDLLMGLRKPESGTVAYKGRNLSGYSRRELALEMALVPQNFYINFPFTALEIVMMGRHPHIPRFSAPSNQDLAVVQEIMEKTGTAAFQDRYMTEMSGGERQRVVFARALAQQTPVLMLDEATSNLDIKHSLTLLDIVSEAVRKRGRTVISVFQDINLAAGCCDRLILIKNGQIAAVGPTEDVLCPENIKTVFDVLSHVYIEPWSQTRKVSFKRSYE